MKGTVLIMARKLKIGLIGCGGIANHAHLPAYEEMDNIEIVYVCDVKIERAESVKERFDCAKNAKVSADYMDVIGDPEVESIDICTPNYLHSIIAVAALDAGKNVLTEKPDAVSVEEVLKMKAAADRSGKVLMAIRNNRFMPCSKYAKAAIDRGDYGEIYAGRCGWIRRRGIPGKGGWFTTKAQSGGGPLIDLGVHMIDLSMYLMGNPTPVSVTGSIYNKFADNTAEADSKEAKFGDAKAGGTFDVEDLAMGFIKFDNGASLQIEFSWASNIERESKFLELRGTKAGIRMDNDELSVFGERDGALYDEYPKCKGMPGHYGAISHYVDVVLNGTKPIFVPEQGVNMIKILSAIYESAKTGKEVLL